MRCFVEAAGVLGPGLDGWQKSRALLARAGAYRFAEFTVPKVEVLPPVERRRTGLPVKLAIAAGQDALLQTDQAAERLATVFASSDSDGDVINQICMTLAGDERQISPTQFHNSVHNAPAGYWSIATGSHAPSTSLCALEWTVAAGLLETAAQVAAQGEPVLLIAYDVPYPQPLRSARPVTHPFGCAILLTHDRERGALGALDIEIGRGTPATRMSDAGLETMRLDNAAARALPLLAGLAKAEQCVIVLEYMAGSALQLRLVPR